MNRDLASEIQSELCSMGANEQRVVLEFIRSFRESSRTPGKELMEFAGSIAIEDLHCIAESIEFGCEQVDVNEW